MINRKLKIGKRLARLINSGICPAEDASMYALDLKQLVKEITNEDQVRRRSRLFKALSDPTRLKMLALLNIREMCVCEIMVALDLTQPTASHHLGILEDVGLVKNRREGKWVFYNLKNKNVTSHLELFEDIKD